MNLVGVAAGRLAYLREGRRDAEGEVVQNPTSELL
jgi:hypothetical protein